MLRRTPLTPVLGNRARRGAVVVGNAPGSIPPCTTGTTLFVDDFGIADGPMGPGWTQMNDGFEVWSNTAMASGLTGVDAVTVVDDTIGDNQWVAADMVEIGGFGLDEARTMLVLRATDSDNLYAAGLGRTASGPNRLRMYRREAGTFFQLADIATPTGFSLPERLLFTAIGNVLRLCWLDGGEYVPQIAAVDSTFASGAVGMHGARNTGAARMDGFAAGDYS